MCRSLILGVWVAMAMVQAQVYTSTNSSQCDGTSLLPLCALDVCCVLQCNTAGVNPQSAIVQSDSKQAVFFSDTGCVNSVMTSTLPVCVGCSDGSGNSVLFADWPSVSARSARPVVSATENCLTIRMSDQQSCTWNNREECQFPEYTLTSEGNSLLVYFPGDDSNLISALLSNPDWDNFGSPGFSDYAMVAGGGNFDDVFWVDTTDPSRWIIRLTLGNEVCSMLRSDTVCNFDGGQITPIFGWPCPAPLYMSLYVNHYNSHTSQGCVVNQPNMGEELYLVSGTRPQYFNDTFFITCH